MGSTARAVVEHHVRPASQLFKVNVQKNLGNKGEFESDWGQKGLLLSLGNWNDRDSAILPTGDRPIVRVIKGY